MQYEKELPNRELYIPCIFIAFDHFSLLLEFVSVEQKTQAE
jgi:hypothetical protein